MLLGTTFAWFTDTASTNVNAIQAGTLDVQLLDKDGNSLEGETLAWQKAEGHENDAVLWELGATYNLQPVTIKNNGNLALKYKIQISGIEGDAKLNEAIEWTTKVGSSNNSITDERSLAPGAAKTMTISGHMKETAGNEYQGLTIEGISITVLATQDTVEYDSNDNQYDANATYGAANIDDLRDAVANGGSVSLDKDIIVAEDELVKTAKGEPAMLIITKDTVIDLNGKSLEYTNGGTCYYGFYVTNGAKLTIKDSSGNNSGSVYANDPEGSWAVFVSEGHADIYGGSFRTADECCIYKNKGTINIYGGKFEADANSQYLLNHGASYGSYGPINVYGGSFKNFEPGVTNGSESKVADGYKVVQNGDWYDVVAK